MAYRQAKATKKRLLKTYNKIKGQRTHGSSGGVWVDAVDGHLYRFYASNTPGYTKRLRRISNKKVRKSTEIYKNSEYRKLFDYKWTVT